MLAWVSNRPDLTDGLLPDFLPGAGSVTVTGSPPATQSRRRRCRSGPRRCDPPTEVGRGPSRRPRSVQAGPVRPWRGVACGSAPRHGVTTCPSWGTSMAPKARTACRSGSGSASCSRAMPGLAGFAAGSDHYLGDMTRSATIDLHFIDAAMAAMNSADQPLTSLEFEAGTGDYSGGLEEQYDASTVDLKTRLCDAQGTASSTTTCWPAESTRTWTSPSATATTESPSPVRAGRRADRAIGSTRADVRRDHRRRPMRWSRTAVGSRTWTRSATTWPWLWPDRS